MATVNVFQGVGMVYTAQAVLADGTPALNVYTGSETLAGNVWAGEAFQATAFTFSASWTPPDGGPLGKVDIAFSAGSTAAVWPGKYSGLVYVVGNTVAVLPLSVVVLPSPLVSLNLPNAFTRAGVDLALLRRVASLLGIAGIAVSAQSPIPEFSLPIAAALDWMGLDAVNPVEPNDADIAAVPARRWMELVDIAESEVLRWATGQLTLRSAANTEERFPDYSYRRDPFAIQWVNTFSDQKTKSLRALYGYGVPRIGLGTINLGFQAKHGPCGTPYYW